jgi:hypothetical protein
MRNLRAWALAVFGAWLVASAWVLPGVTWNAIVFGGLILLDGVWLAMDPAGAGAWRGWAAAALAAWTAVSPWLLGYSARAGATWSSLIAGLLAAASGVWLALAPAGAPSHQPTVSQPGLRKAG